MAKYELRSEKNKVILGDKEFIKYIPADKNPYNFYWRAKEWGFDMGVYDNHPKVLNKTLCDSFGSKIPYRFSAAVYNTFIKDNFPRETHFAISHLGYHWKKFNSVRVNKALENYHLVEQALRDKTINLLPLMLAYGEDTQQLKKRFGKGLWKKLANTSKSRMKYLAEVIDENGEWVDVRTGILQEVKGRLWDGSELIAAKLSPTVRQYRETLHVIGDTIRMAKQKWEPYNPEWSLKRWQEEHDRLTKMTLLGKYSDKPFCDAVTYEEDGYTFTLLNNQMAIATEGKTMHHCVGSYAGLAAQGSYAVFRVEGNNERATLGLELAALGEKRFEFNQCYGLCNSRVSDRLRDAAHRVLRKFNDDRIRCGDGRVSGSSDQGACPLLDNRREGVQLDQQLRGNAFPAVWYDDLNWA